MSHLRMFAAAVALLAMSAAALADHAVKLDRTYKVGDQYHVKATVKMNAATRVELGGQVVPTPAQAQTMDFEADAVVDEVHADGRSKKATFTVVKAEGTHNGQAKRYFAPGSKVVVAAAGKDTEYHDGEGNPLDPQLKGLLSGAVDVSPEHQSADRMFGTPDAQPVGGKWPANADAIKADIGREGVDTTNAKVEGGSELTAREGDGSRIKTQVTLSDFAPPAGGLPPGMQLKDTKISITRNAVYPDNAGKPVTGESQQMAMSMNAASDPASPQQMSMSIVVTTDANVERTAK